MLGSMCGKERGSIKQDDSVMEGQAQEIRAGAPWGNVGSALMSSPLSQAFYLLISSFLLLLFFKFQPLMNEKLERLEMLNEYHSDFLHAYHRVKNC